ncbi:MAG: ABC transporter permease [Blastopirellula sp. JB062]
MDRAWKRFSANRGAIFGGVVVLFACLIALTADVIAPYPIDQRSEKLAPPSQQHWLGTDTNEKDVLTWVIYGSRLSLTAGGLSIVLAIFIGVPLGAAAGYFPGAVDQAIMRSIDVVLAFPAILIALLVMAALAPGWPAVIVAVGLINIPIFARQIRATTLTLRSHEYVTAAVAAGATTRHIFIWTLLPGLVGPLVVLATLGLGSAILEVAGLSFLGISGDPTTPEWGGMLAEAKNDLSTSVWPAIAPGFAISLTILGFNLLGDGLRDALDPRLEGSR